MSKPLISAGDLEGTLYLLGTEGKDVSLRDVGVVYAAIPGTQQGICFIGHAYKSMYYPTIANVIVGSAFADRADAQQHAQDVKEQLIRDIEVACLTQRGDM